MEDAQEYFRRQIGRFLAVTEIGKLLGVSRVTARKRLDDGLTSDEIVTISRNLGISPVHSLVDLGKLTVEEVFEYLESDGTLLTSASDEQLTFQLASNMLTLNEKRQLAGLAEQQSKTVNELAERRKKKDVQEIDYDDGTVRDFSEYEGIEYAADSSPDEDALREEYGIDPID